jgi:hypothetical protein
MNLNLHEFFKLQDYFVIYVPSHNNILLGIEYFFFSTFQNIGFLTIFKFFVFCLIQTKNFYFQVIKTYSRLLKNLVRCSRCSFSLEIIPLITTLNFLSSVLFNKSVYILIDCTSRSI